MSISPSVRFPAAGCVDDPWRSHTVRIAAITDEVPGVRTYELHFEDQEVGRAYRFAAGQFNMLHLPGIGEAAISISSDVEEPERLAHTVRAVGNVTDALARMEIGETLMLRGPYGRPWPVDALAGRHAVIIGGGLGLASQRAAIYELARHRAGCTQVTVIHGAKTPEGLFYTREYESWRAAGIELEIIVDEPAAGWDGRVGLVTAVLESMALEGPAAVLCCGPDPMMTAVASTAKSRGVPSDSIYLSLERNMACAVRQCGLCQFGPKFVCQDGPVFPHAEIAPYLCVPQL